MPTITVTGGPSNAGARPGEVGYIGLEAEHGPELTELPPGRFVEPAGAPAAADEDSGSADLPPSAGPASDHASMTVAQLREAAKTRGLPVGGSKADLVARVAEHDAASAPKEA